MPNRWAIAAVGVVMQVAPAHTQPPPRLEAIRARGFLTCGVNPVVPGFAEIDARGRYRGFDIDICRALSTAILGSPDKVRFVTILNVAEFLRRDEIDLVSRRLTWELSREAPLGLLFGPITFYDGQGFLVATKLGIAGPGALANVSLCVAGGTPFELTASTYFAEHRIEVKKVVLEKADDFNAIARALASGRCQAYTADVSELGAIRSKLPDPDSFTILDELISKEPLSPLVRDRDPRLFDVLRWTILALIRAEELGVSAANVDEMRRSPSVDVQRLLGVIPGNGRALGLDEAWAYDVIRALGNYGEIFGRNVGRESPIGLARGLNRLAKDGGLMYAPPVR